MGENRVGRFVWRAEVETGLASLRAVESIHQVC